MKLTDAQRTFLSSPRYAVLATINADGSPQQTVMWYLLQGDTIMMNTMRGRKKDRNILRDSRASLCIEDGETYVTITGRITIDGDRERSLETKHQLAIQYEGEERAAEMVRETYAQQERITLYLSIDRVDSYGLG